MDIFVHYVQLFLIDAQGLSILLYFYSVGMHEIDVTKVTVIHIYNGLKHFYFEEFWKNCIISILEWFLKDHMTLKAGEMAAKNISFHL